MVHGAREAHKGSRCHSRQCRQCCSARKARTRCWRSVTFRRLRRHVIAWLERTAADGAQPGSGREVLAGENVEDGTRKGGTSPNRVEKRRSTGFSSKMGI